MKQVFKYQIPFEGSFKLNLPEGSRMLSVQLQGDLPCLWVLVDPYAALVSYDFVCRGTGHKADCLGAAEFLGTVQFDNGALIFHFFSLTPQ